MSGNDEVTGTDIRPGLITRYLLYLISWYERFIDFVGSLFGFDRNTFLDVQILTRLVVFLMGGSQRYATILIRQSALETAHGKSRIFKLGSNAFGMKPIMQRPNYADGTITIDGATYANYRSITHSIADRILWDRWNGIEYSTTDDDYLDAIQAANYSTDPDYKTKVKDQDISFFASIADAPKSLFKWWFFFVILFLIISNVTKKKRYNPFVIMARYSPFGKRYLYRLGRSTQLRKKSWVRRYFRRRRKRQFKRWSKKGKRKHRRSTRRRR